MFNELSRNRRIHYVSDIHFKNNIKLETFEDLPSGINGAGKLRTFDNVTMLRNSNLNMPPISSFCTPSLVSNQCNNYSLTSYKQSSDGENSPKSLEENESRSPTTTLSRNNKIEKVTEKVTKSYSKVSNKGKRRAQKVDEQCPKEKDRARVFNEAFDGLRKRIPSIPASKKLSKIEILRLAICYMSYLKFLLESDFPNKKMDEE